VTAELAPPARRFRAVDAIASPADPAPLDRPSGAEPGARPDSLGERLARLRALDHRLLTAAQLPSSPPRPSVVAGLDDPAVRSVRLAEVLGGRLVDGPAGRVVIVEDEEDLPFDPAPLAALPFPIDPLRPLVMLDTETTGLGTGTGTFAFLIGLAIWEAGRLRVCQLWLPDQPDEPALLDALERAIPPEGWLVTYNGRSFDWPLIATRFRLHRRSPPPTAGHLDLLSVARQLWRHRLPDARLASVESAIAGVRRPSDLPGALVPDRYLAFLRTGEPGGLVAVGEHNRQDVVSLAGLLAVLADHLGRPERRGQAPAGDLLGLGRAYRRHGRFDEALACLDAALTAQAGRPPGQGPASRDAQLQASIERACLLRRLGRGSEAIEAWRLVAGYGGKPAILAWIAIAKELEHHVRDPAAALAAVRRAEELLSRRRALGSFFAEAERDLPHRRARLQRRSSVAAGAAVAGTGRDRRSGPTMEPTGQALPIRHPLQTDILDHQRRSRGR
jgi:uncharacterized protein